MKIVYDISVLGKGFYIPRARTGVFRVIENLAQELVKTKAIYAFSATYGVEDYFKCVDYLHSNPILSSVPVIEPDLNKKIQKALQSFHKRVYKDTTDQAYLKSIKRIITRLSEKIFLRNILSKEILDTADLYHSPFYPIPGQVKRINKLKKVITVYDLIPLLFPQFFEDRFLSRATKQLLESIDEDTRVICISHATKNDLCNFLPSLDPNKVFVTHLAASSLFYLCKDQLKIEAVKRKLGIPAGHYILSLSTLAAHKNIVQTIKCFSHIVEEERLNDLSLVLVGASGWNSNLIFNLIKASPKIKDRIIVAGWVSDQDLAPLYSGALMFVYPSFYEGFGLPPLEAMQCGVPVITSNTSSLPEVVGKAGILVDPNDGVSVCQAMLEIYYSGELRQKMSDDSLVQAGQFSWKKCAEQTIEVYKSTLSDR